MSQARLLRVMYWTTTSIIPIFSLLTVLAITIQPWALIVSYKSLPVPYDLYGFSVDDRLNYANMTIQYLRGQISLNVLSTLTLPRNLIAPDQSCQILEDCAKLFKQRELDHLVDVRSVLSTFSLIWMLSIAFLVILFLLSFKYRLSKTYWIAVCHGSLLTILLVSLLIVISISSFMLVFDGVHDLLFRPGTWIFPHTDTLIRLFPEEFWRNILIWFATISIMLSLFLVGLSWHLSRRA
jgi:integral membrane protein (TIGR01906 family)